ncbi:MAG: hypothetical protein WBI04_01060 [Trichlorobacter sp.]
MTTLVITDIPRISALFEQIASRRGGLVVVSEIHRGIEELDRHKPGLIILQNHLSGLSADIVQKHLKSRLGKRKVRFALISPSESLDVELSARFEAILDPALSDERLTQILEELLSQPERAARSTGTPVSSILELPPIRQQEPELPGLQPEPPPNLAGAADMVQISSPPPPTSATDLSAAAPLPDQSLPEPATYDLPRRANSSIISAFSQHLDHTAAELAPDPTRFSDRDNDLAIRDLHRQPHLLQDEQRPATPFFRRTGLWLLSGTVVVVIIITLIQQRPGSSRKTDTEAPAPALPVEPAAVAPPPTPAPIGHRGLQSHGAGRPRALPSFIPQAGIDRSYTKDNPGWESYHGQASEYRIFREKDNAIKAVQVIDRSGAGIQDAFYISVLKELAGATAMRPTSSEIREGYEIRRGVVAGLELVQYRDAQGGRLRGFVVTWP